MIFSTGYEQQVFDQYYGQQARINRDLDQTTLIKSKSLDVRYNLLFRDKHKPRNDYENNESLSLQFDQDLSPDFNRCHVDSKTGKSLTLSLVSSQQRYCGDTALTLHAVYINEKQELFTNCILTRCETLPGTIENRLKHYKATFDKKCDELMAEYFNHGFTVQEEHILSNMASFLHFARDGNGESYLCEYTPIATINQLLTIFSVRNGDCFHQDYLQEALFTSIADHPFVAARDHRHTKANIPADQESELLAIAELRVRNEKALNELFDQCHYSPRASVGRFDYVMFKEGFLNLRLQ